VTGVTPLKRSHINPKCEAGTPIVKGATLKVIAGAPHGMCSTLKDQINTELLAFSGASA
jgi:non-heme chloroperoxidase